MSLGRLSLGAPTEVSVCKREGKQEAGALASNSRSKHVIFTASPSLGGSTQETMTIGRLVDIYVRLLAVRSMFGVAEASKYHM